MPPRSRRNPAALAFEAERRRRRTEDRTGDGTGDGTGSRASALPTGRFWEVVRSAVRRGDLPAGTRLEEADLLRRFGASRASVRAGLRLLAAEGLVRREARSGTPVVLDAAEVDARQVVAGSRADRSAPLRVRELVAERLRPVPAVLAGLLEVDPEEPVLRLEQVGELAGRPIYLRSAYLPLRGVADLHDRVLRLDEDPRPLDDAFVRLFGTGPGAVESTLTAVPAGRSVAQHLGIERGSPVLVRDMVLRDAAGRLRDLSTTYFRGDAVSMTTLPQAP